MVNDTPINLEKFYDDRKGIYVLSYNDKKPYKIGMTNAPIWKRINSYVNCPSQYDGHWIHLLLTYPVTSPINAKQVEGKIFRLIKEKHPDARVNSTQRKTNKATEHFDLSIAEIKKILVQVANDYNKEKSMNMKVSTLRNKTVKHSFVVKGKNKTKSV